jgi:Mce-associated membrane protein
MNPTLYDILGVPEDASRDEIRKAWRDAADRFEPGEGGSTKQFRLFNEAAEVLLDPDRRKEYDAQLANGNEPETADPAGAAAVSVGKGPKGEKAGKPKALKLRKQGKTAGALTESVRAAGTVPDAPIPGTARATTGPLATAGDRGGEPEAPDGPEGSSSSPNVPGLVLAVLGVLAAVAIGLAAFFVTQGLRAEAYKEALDRAPAAAENAAAAVLSYDYKSLEADRDAGARFLSDGYRKQYVDTFDKLVQKSASESKATVKADVLASSAMVTGEDRDPDRVPVLLFVNQTTTSAATTEQPSVALNRVRFDMVRSEGTWLVDGITSY